MSFKLWSLDFINYPVSGIMWIWHKIFGLVLGNASPWTWVLSVIFLVFTLRAVLFKPFMKQMDSQLKMQAIQPEMKRLRAKYKDDRQRLTEEMMKLNKEAGVNPLASCLPMLLQAPAFIGLFQVIRHFDDAYGDGSNVSNNFFFSADDVRSFHDAVLFGGASLAGHLLSFANGSIGPATEKLHSLGANFSTQLSVAVPLMIIAAVATHMTSRRSLARQRQMGTAQTTGAMAIMPKLMLYVFPLAVLGIGWFYELALLFYWLANNSWTFFQLAVAHRAQDKKLAAESKVVEEAKASATFSKPKPGAKPMKPRPGAKPQAGAKPQPGAKPQAGAKPQPGAKPKPGAKPQRSGSTSAAQSRQAKSQTQQASSSGANGGAAKKSTITPSPVTRSGTNGSAGSSTKPAGDTGARSGSKPPPGTVSGSGAKKKRNKKGRR